MDRLSKGTDEMQADIAAGLSRAVAVDYVQCVYANRA